jgi:hypothetical protein
MTGHCIWCGALAFTDNDGDLLWVLTPEMPPCENHELMDGTDAQWETPARYFNFAAPADWPDADDLWLRPNEDTP